MPVKPRTIDVVPRAKRQPWQKRADAPKRLTGPRLQARNKRIKERDGYTCQNRQCGAVTMELQVDHVVPLCAGGGEEDGNLQTLCTVCNQAKGLAESRGELLLNPRSFDPDEVRRKRR